MLYGPPSSDLGSDGLPGLAARHSAVLENHLIQVTGNARGYSRRLQKWQTMGKASLGCIRGPKNVYSGTIQGEGR